VYSLGGMKNTMSVFSVLRPVYSLGEMKNTMSVFSVLRTEKKRTLSKDSTP
jgi:hypothetical protein